jgi:2-hydroxychromene-2-carboxylate isomerase
MSFNVLNMAIAQHFENVDSAINYLVGLYKDDVDITDKNVFNKVMRRYGLNDDGFESERDYIMSEVKRRIA